MIGKTTRRNDQTVAMSLEPAERKALLTAVVGHVLPAPEQPVEGVPDDYDGVAAGVPDYLEGLFGDAGKSSPYANQTGLIDWGLRFIQAEHQVRHGKDFADGDPAECRALLHDLETMQHRDYAVFWDTFIRICLEGFLAHPRHGGNRGALAWRLAGYPGGTEDRLTADADNGVKEGG